MAKMDAQNKVIAALFFTSLIFFVSSTNAQDYPVSIEHKFGTTVVTQKPKRVISISFIGHDFLLALGVKPFALRPWYGGNEFGVWPWAENALGNAKPQVMRGEIDIEKIALLEPDLIEAQWSGMTEREYSILSKIAPTIAAEKGASDYGSSWSHMLLQLGLATDNAENARAIIKDINQKFKEIRGRFPQWEKATTAVSWAGTVGAYTSKDIRGQFMEKLGFQIPKNIDELRGGNAYFNPIPLEDFSFLDQDVVIWLDTGGSVSKLKSLSLRFTMDAYKQGREIYADPLLSSAFSHSSPLSISYVLEKLIPLIEQAIDGDPRTEVLTTKEVGLSPRF